MVEWKTITNYEDYMVSNDGQIKKHNVIMKASMDSYGYKVISLRNSRGRKMYKVHRLVCEAFNENPNNLPVVNHIDECKTNNHVNNLEWTTAANNSRHSASINKQTVIGIRKDVFCGMSIRQAAVKYGVEYKNAWQIVVGKTWQNIPTYYEIDPKPKYSSKTVNCIKADLASGKYKQVDIAREYGVSKAMVGRLANGVIWNRQ